MGSCPQRVDEAPGVGEVARDDLGAGAVVREPSEPDAAGIDERSLPSHCRNVVEADVATFADGECGAVR